MKRRPCDVITIGIGLLLGTIALQLLHAGSIGDTARFERIRQLAEALDLTDLSLFTEARYARHHTQTDLHSAFQDGPRALEHFPAGTLIMPPRTFPTGGFSHEGTAP